MKEVEENDGFIDAKGMTGQEINLNTEQGRAIAAQNIISLNANLLSASEKYMKDKKSVRGTTEGEYRFNNTIDSLAIMSRKEREPKKHMTMEKKMQKV